MNTDQLRALAARLQNFADRKAALLAEQERIIGGADPALDDRVIARLSAITTGLKLAEDVIEPRLRDEADAMSSGLTAAGRRVRDLQERFAEAFAEQLRRQTPEEFRGAVFIEQAPAYVAELSAMYAPAVEYAAAQYRSGKTIAEIAINLRNQIPELERCDAEEARLRKRLAKLT